MDTPSFRNPILTKSANILAIFVKPLPPIPICWNPTSQKFVFTSARPKLMVWHLSVFIAFLNTFTAIFLLVRQLFVQDGFLQFSHIVIFVGGVIMGMYQSSVDFCLLSYGAEYVLVLNNLVPFSTKLQKAYSSFSIKSKPPELGSRISTFIFNLDNHVCSMIVIFLGVSTPSVTFGGVYLHKDPFYHLLRLVDRAFPTWKLDTFLHNSIPNLLLRFLVIIPLVVHVSTSLALVIIIFLSALRFSCNVFESLIQLSGNGVPINLSKLIRIYSSYAILLRGNCNFQETVTFILMGLGLWVQALFNYGAVIGFGVVPIYLYWYIFGGVILTFTAINLLMFYPYKMNDFSEMLLKLWKLAGVQIANR
ncbi:hypothetical protein Fcan01_01481 [Folsomia candida]|uniref:Uncharacterized protein n=1 Tax=Folsomia candida TaxID=158441 RepID=A0A226F4K2_FOLCA|nr:hypothetical protein Fcan01_01481 [Folsomia candida]